MFLIPYLDLLAMYGLLVYCFILSRRMKALATSVSCKTDFVSGEVVPIRWSGRR